MAEDSVIDFPSCTYMEGADIGLLMAVVRNAEHVLQPNFPPVILGRCNLRPKTHNIVTLFP